MRFAQAITLVFALILLMQFFLEVPAIETAGGHLTSWNIVIAAFAMGLAAFNLIRIHLKRVQLKRGNWISSAILLIVLVVQTFVGLYFGDNSAQYKVFFDGIISPLGATMYAMLAFWIASAAFRAFKARTLDATILLCVGIIVMLGNAPIGEIIWSQFPALRSWLMTVPAMAAVRALYIGAAIGGIAVGVRVLLGIERGHLGGGE